VGGQEIAGFRQEPGVDAQSPTDTYAAVTFFVENWRWAGVPFYVRTGKRLPKRVTEIAIQFNPAPLHIFDADGGESAPNLLIVRIQPEEGISLKFLSKRPGAGMTLRPVSMDFNYGSSFGERSPSAYETLLLDAIVGDATLYTRQDMVEASWSVVEPIQNVWRETKFDFPNYAAGTWGPARPMRCWRGAGTRGGSRSGRRGARTHLRELADLWVSLAACCAPCTLTLVVLEEAGDDAAKLGETIAALMPEHPARTMWSD